MCGSEGACVDQGDERIDDMTTEHDEHDEAVFEADTAELKAVTAPPASSGSAPESNHSAPLPAEDSVSDSNAGDVAVNTAESHPQSPPDISPAAQVDSSPLAPGASVGGYRIERVLRSTTDEVTYLAVEVGVGAAEGTEGTEGVENAEDSAPPAPAAHVILIERQPGSFAAASGIVTLRLRHPRLLAPREVVEQGGHEYLVVETITGPDGTLAETVAQGARLDPPTALATGAGLADALSYLHRNSVAHLHVSPDVLVVTGGRAYLGGMESAERVAQGAGDVSALFARDANFLARSLGVLAGLSEEPGPNESLTVDVLRQVVAYGAANSFTNVDDVAATCAAALQTTPSLALNGEAASGRLAFLSAAATSVGRVRSENQDACARVIFDIFDDISGDMPLNVFLIADGMGGEAKGEVASRIAARTVPAEMVRSFAVSELLRPVEAATGDESSTLLYTDEKPSLSTALARAVNEANRRVRDLSAQIGQTTGTTLTVIATRGSHATLAHLGDSRAYLLRGETMAQLTEDHSVLARLQAIDHPLLSDPDVFVPRNMLYRSLGQEDDANADTLDFTLSDGDRLMLCSDGLWDEVDDYAIAETLASAGDPRTCAERLVALANASGGHDNSTALVIFVRSAPNLDEAPSDDAVADATTGEARETPQPEEH